MDTDQATPQVVRVVAVIGAGTMGSGIAQVFAQAGVAVDLVDASAGALPKARAAITRSLSRLVDKSALSAEAREPIAPRKGSSTQPCAYLSVLSLTRIGPALGRSRR